MCKPVSGIATFSASASLRKSVLPGSCEACARSLMNNLSCSAKANLCAPDGYESLYRHLTGQPKRPKPELSQETNLPPERLPVLPARKNTHPEMPGRALDELGRDETERNFLIEQQDLVLNQAIMPSIFTSDRKIIRQDCLGISWGESCAWPDCMDHRLRPG